jgi:hypothetical protein
MGQTPIHGFPYPELSDPPNVPADMKKLAEAVESGIPPSVRTLTAFLTTDSGLPATSQWYPVNLGSTSSVYKNQGYLELSNGKITVLRKGVCIVIGLVHINVEAALRILENGQPLTAAYIRLPLGAGGTSTMGVFSAGTVLALEAYAYAGTGITVVGGSKNTRLSVLFLHETA